MMLQGRGGAAMFVGGAGRAATVLVYENGVWGE